LSKGRGLAIAVLTMALVAAACGSSKKKSTTNPTTESNVKRGGEIVLGAEQFPQCVNPITQCANSSWMVWTTAFPLLPSVWDTSADGYEITPLVTEEPTVELG